MRCSICVEMIYPDLPFEQKVEQVCEAGFGAIEFWAWKDKNLDFLERKVVQGMQVAVFSGQRQGSLVEPADLQSYLAQVEESVRVARRLRCGELMVLSDELSADGSVQTRYRPMTDDKRRDNMIDGLKRLAPLAEREGITLLLEPLNTRVDHHGYSLSCTAQGARIIDAVGSPRVKLLYDIYHMQIMEGNVLATLSDHLERIGHIHVADVPGRHEPGTGELDFSNILCRLGELGYKGYVGFEMQPAGRSDRALAAIAELCRTAGVEIGSPS